jgi:hypothetical protein
MPNSRSSYARATTGIDGSNTTFDVSEGIELAVNEASLRPYTAFLRSVKFPLATRVYYIELVYLLQEAVLHTPYSPGLRLTAVPVGGLGCGQIRQKVSG